MNVRVGHRSDAAAAARPAEAGQRRNLYGHIVAQFKAVLIAQCVPQVVEVDGLARQLVQQPRDANVGQHTLAVHGFAGIRRAAVTLSTTDEGVIVVYLAALHGGQVGGVARQLHQRSLSGQAPGAAQGIVFQPCARLLRQGKRVLAVAVACRRQPWHHALHKGEPVGVVDAAGGFEPIGL